MCVASFDLVSVNFGTGHVIFCVSIDPFVDKTFDVQPHAIITMQNPRAGQHSRTSPGSANIAICLHTAMSSAADPCMPVLCRRIGCKGQESDPVMACALQNRRGKRFESFIAPRDVPSDP